MGADILATDRPIEAAKACKIARDKNHPKNIYLKR